METNIKFDTALIPSPLKNASLYRHISTFHPEAIKSRTTSIAPFLVSTKYLVLGFRDQGACIQLHSVKVSYNVCPEDTLRKSLIHLTKTIAPSNDSESIIVKGSCISGSVHMKGSLNVPCKSSGEWNASGLEGRCVCKEDMENKGGMCKGIPFYGTCKY